MAIINKIAFIEARSPGEHIYSKFPIPRLGAVLLGTILKNQGYTVKVFVEDIAPIDWSFVESSDLVGISTITSTAARAYELADLIRRKGIPVILGGAHPTFMPEEALRHADYVVRGEADLTILPLIESLKKGDLSPVNIKGLSFIDPSGRVFHTPPAELLKDLDSLPFPDMSIVHAFKPENIYPISTSRGCPFDCKFCSVIQMFGRRYRYRSVEKTIEDIKRASKLSKGTIFFVDDNFAAHKERTKEILRGIIQEGIKVQWSAQVRIDVARDEELLRLMAESGCHTLYIGFESINPETLKLYNKKQGLEDIVECINKVHEAGIHIHGMFVLGADTDDVETIKKTSDFAKRLKIDTVQFLMLTPLPGTPVFFEMLNSGRLFHTDWSKYDAHHVVFRPSRISPRMLHMETLQAMKRFYSWNYILRHIIRLNFHYAVIGLYGRRALKKALKMARNYLESIDLLSPLEMPVFKQN